MLTNLVPKTVVGLVQIGVVNRRRGRTEEWHVRGGIPMPKPTFKILEEEQQSFVYLPYSVGLLQAYVQKHSPNPERYEFLIPLFKRIQVAEAVAHLKEAHVVGFSAYIWNIQLTLSIAKALKEANPDVVIVFGGPQVPDRAEAFLRENRFIDIVCHGEGEAVFLQILEKAQSGDWEGVSSVSYLREGGEFINHVRLSRINDLSVIPSPFLSGVFDSLLAEYKEHQWMVLWETNRGCPFSCTFCDWGSAVASKVYRFDMERLLAEIDWFVAHGLYHIFVCDANFGILPRDWDLTQHLIETYKKHQLPLGIGIQNTKNATERSYQIQKALAKRNSIGVTISLQSIDTTTLENIKRDNISLGSFHELQRRYTRDKIPTYTDIILGLPGETYDSFANGTAEIIARGQHNRLAIHNCSILPNAEMGHPDYQKRFGIVYVPMPIISEHDTLDMDQEQSPQEYIDIVVETKSMDAADWRRSRVFAWAVELFHFDKLLQIVFVILHDVYNISYRHAVENILSADSERFPVCGEIREIFMKKATSMQAGGDTEHIASPDWLNIWWPADQYVFIYLARHEKLAKFYDEVRSIFTRLVASKTPSISSKILEQAILLNQNMLRLPFLFSNKKLLLDYNIYEFYQGIKAGTPIPLRESSTLYQIERISTVWVSWEAWYEDIIMRIFDKSPFFYTLNRVESPMVRVPNVIQQQAEVG